MDSAVGAVPTPDGRSSAHEHHAWSRRSVARFVWTATSSIAVETLILGLSAALPLSVLRWCSSWDVSPAWLDSLVLVAAFVPAYLAFAVLVMIVSAVAMRLLGWRPEAPADLVIAEVSPALSDWARYQISSHVVGFVAGGLLRSTPLWSMYMRFNGARLGRRVWVNSLGVTDHCLLEFGDDVVIGAGVHLSAHTVERGVVRLAPVSIGAGSTVGVNAHVEIGSVIGPSCQIGSLSMVPKFSRLDEAGTYVGVPVRRIERHAESMTAMREGGAS